MRRQFNNIVSVIYTAVRLAILKVFIGKNLKTSLIQRISPDVVIEVNRGGVLQLGKQVRIHSGCKVKVRGCGNLVIGDKVKMNYNCMVFCRKSITIGAGCEFGPNVLVYDHDHDFRCDCGLKADKYITESVKIGNNCWLGANTVILRGTDIGDNCVVAAGSIVKGNFASDSMIYQVKEARIKQIHETEHERELNE